MQPFWRRNIFILILLLWLTGSGQTQQLFGPNTSPYWDWLGRSEGLSNLSVSAIVQDRYGFMWFGTQNGLNLFDGQKITVFRSNPFDDDALIHNLIQTMYYDPEEHFLWLGTYQGLSLLRIASGDFVNYPPGPEGLSNPVVTAIIKDPRYGGLWVGTLAGLNYLDSLAGQWRQFEVPGDVVRTLVFDDRNELWVGTYEGLYRLDPLEEQWYAFAGELPSPSVMSLDPYAPGRMLAGLWDGGMVDLNLDTGEIEVFSFSDNRVYTVFEAEDGCRWAGTWGGGLMGVDRDGQIYEFAPEPDADGLRHPIVYSLFQDHSGVLWIGTNGGGLHKLSPRKREYLRYVHTPGDPLSLPLGKTSVVYRDRQDRLWIAIYNAGLSRFDPDWDGFVHYRVQNDIGLPSDNVNTVLETSRGELLVGTNGGLVMYDDTTDQFLPFGAALDSALIYALAEGSDDQLWIGTYTAGLIRYDRGSNTLTEFSYDRERSASLSDNLVYDILIDSQERIWVATNNGLNRFLPEEEGFQRYNRVLGDRSQLGSGATRVLFEDSLGQIWVGTAGAGLYLYREETDSFLHFLEEQGMPSSVIVSLEEDAFGRLWAGTHSGLAVIDPAVPTVLTTLSEEDGLGGWEFNTGSFHDSDGTLLFGGTHGITAIHDFLLGTDVYPPRVYITGVERFDNQVRTFHQFYNGETITLPSGQNYVGFEFTAADYDAPDKTAFSFQMEGLDSQLIHAGQRNYTNYSNIPPGTYRFVVSAVTAAGTEAETPAFLHVHVPQPWYLTHAAYVLYIVLLSVAIAIGVRLWQWPLLQRRNAELAYANQRLEELNDELARVSVKDALTGLFNRRYFDSRLAEQLAAARRTQVPLTVLMFDLDRFKQYNDTLGHVAGDVLLQAVGRAAQQVLHRSTDFAARYGGDEMAAVLFDTDAKGAQQQAQVLHRTLLDTMEACAAANHHPEPPTVSIGVVTIIPNKETTPMRLIKAADQALYQAKAQGKNRVLIGKIEPETL